MPKGPELPAATGPSLLVDLNAKRSNDATPMLDFIGVEFGEFLAGHCPRLKAERLDTINKSRRLDNLPNSLLSRSSTGFGTPAVV